MLRKAGGSEELVLQLCPKDDGSHVTIKLDRSKPLGLRIKEGTNGNTPCMHAQMNKCGIILACMFRLYNSDQSYRRITGTRNWTNTYRR